MENIDETNLRVWLFYGQPYGRSPYGRFSDSNSFPFLVIFLSFSDFRNFFLREILEREFFDEKKLETKIWETKIEKFYKKKFGI